MKKEEPPLNLPEIKDEPPQKIIAEPVKNPTVVKSR